MKRYIVYSFLLLLHGVCQAEVQIKCPNSFDLGTWISSSVDNRVSIDSNGIIIADDMSKYLKGASEGLCYVQDSSLLPGAKVEVQVKAIALSKSIELLGAQCNFANTKTDCYHKPMIVKLKDSRPHYFSLGFTVNIKPHQDNQNAVLFQYSVDAIKQGSGLTGRRLSKI